MTDAEVVPRTPIVTGRAGLRRAIVDIAVPMTVAEMVGVLVPITVVALMGWMGDEALYVRSLYMPLAFLFIAIQTAFDVSNQTATAITSGREARHDVIPIALSMARVWICVGLVTVVLAMVGAPFLADLLSVRASARGDFEWFVRWMSLANLTLVWPVLCASSLRGAGHPRAAAAITLTNASIEIGGVAALGLGAGLGVSAVPLATVAATVTGGVLGLVLLRRAGLAGSFRRVTWHREVVGQVLEIGLPVGMSYIVLFGMNLALLWVLTPFAPAVISGFSIAITVQSLMYMPGIVLGSAMAIVMNRQRGADRRSPVAPIFRVGLRVTIVVYAVLAVAGWLCRDLIGHLTSSDPQVAAQTAHFLGVVGPTYFVMGLVLASLTAIEQIGGGFVAVGLNVVYVCTIVIVGGMIARSVHNADGLYYTMMGTNLAGVLAVLVALVFVSRLDRRNNGSAARG